MNKSSVTDVLSNGKIKISDLAPGFFEGVSKVVKSFTGTICKIDGNANRAQTLKASKTYRESLRSLIYDLDCTVELGIRNELDVDNVEQLYDIVSDAELLWHFCEIISMNSSDLLFAESVQWLQDCIEDSEPLIIPDMELDVFPNYFKDEMNGSYEFWSMISNLTLRGRVIELWALLSLHPLLYTSKLDLSPDSNETSSEDKACAQQLEYVFTQHPYVSFQKSKDITKYDEHFFQWRSNVLSLRNSGQPLLSKIPELNIILRVLSGDERAFQSIMRKDFSDEDGAPSPVLWQSKVLFQLLFTNVPPRSRYDIIHTFEKALNKELIDDRDMKDSQELPQGGMKDRLLLDVMQGNHGRLLAFFHKRSLAGTAAPFGPLLNAMVAGHLSNLLRLIDAVDDHPLHPTPGPTTVTQNALLPYGAHRAGDDRTISAPSLSLGLTDELLLFALELLVQSSLPTLPETLETYARAMSRRRGYQGTDGSSHANGTEPSPVPSPQILEVIGQLLCKLPAARTNRSGVDMGVERVCAVLTRLGLTEHANELYLARGMWWLNYQKGATDTDNDFAAGGGRYRAKAVYFFGKAVARGEARVKALLERSLLRCMRAVVRSRCFEGLLNLLPKGLVIDDPEVMVGPEETDGLELQAALLEAQELSISVHTETHPRNESATSQSHLQPGLVEGYWLDCYRKAIRTMLLITASRESSVDSNQSLNSKVEDASKTLCALLDLSDSNLCLPLRFIPHFISLITWMNLPTVPSDNKQPQLESQLRDVLVNQLTKEEIYDLMASLQTVSIHILTKDIFELRFFNELRLQLLKTLTLAAIQENSDRSKSDSFIANIRSESRSDKTALNQNVANSTAVGFGVFPVHQPSNTAQKKAQSIAVKRLIGCPPPCF